jgi:hypothetical protein
VGKTKILHVFLEEINELHPSVKFTMQHTTSKTENEEDSCHCPEADSIPYLDTSCSIKNGQIVLDLYRKPTDRNKYLLPGSCHPPSCVANIPLSLAMRITRICSEPQTRDMRYAELKNMLLDREYREGMIDAAIAKAKSIPREQAIKRVARDNNPTVRRPVFVATWDPRLPNIPAITKRHWRSMTSQDPYLEEVFPQPPLMAYRRQRNIGDKLIRAKVPKEMCHREQRKLTGMKKCNKPCHTCPYIQERKKVKSGQYIWHINSSMDCRTENIIYLIQCDKENCGEKYVGETERRLKDRMREHRGYVENMKLNTATGYHFNTKGHSSDNMKVTILEKLKNKHPFYRKEREKYHIRKFNSYYNGLNRTPGIQ